MSRVLSPHHHLRHHHSYHLPCRQPKYPSFDVPNANLNALYFDSPDNFNGDFTLLANFTNPNTKIKLHFDYLHVQLYFVDRLIATQALQPFSQRPGEGRLEMIRLISKLVYLPPNPAFQLQRQVQSNRIEYNIKATFRVTAKLASARFTYWLHSSCNLQMTSPPKGLLLTRDCNTKR
ncbi:NDR1/HIN1-like protein 2 [Bienertia sinuspersici]